MIRNGLRLSIVAHPTIYQASGAEESFVDELDKLLFEVRLVHDED